MKREVEKFKKNSKSDKQHSRVGRTFTLNELQKLFANTKIKAIIS